MKIITIDNPIIYLIPRVYPELSDNLTSEIINEDTNDVFNTEPLIWTLEKNFVKIAAWDINLLIPNINYEFTLFNGANIIYKGKLVLLANNTDIQNFEPSDRWI